MEVLLIKAGVEERKRRVKGLVGDKRHKFTATSGLGNQSCVTQTLLQVGARALTQGVRVFVL